MKRFQFLILCFWTMMLGCLSACEEEPIPVIPSPDPPGESIGEVKPTLNLTLSNDLACSGEEIAFSIKDLTGKFIALTEVNFSLIPEIGTLNLATGKYIAPEGIYEPLLIEFVAELKQDTTIKSGKVIRLRPKDNGSYVLSGFQDFNIFIDSGILPDGTLIFASNNPVDPPVVEGQFNFELFGADQQGNLLWHKNLGVGILRRIHVGEEAIYGFGYLDGYVVVKFDFQGNLLAKKNLNIGKEINHFSLESIKSALNENDELVIISPFSQNPVTGTFKLDKDLNLLSSKDASARGLELLPLGNSAFVLIDSEDGDFTVTDSELKPVWNKEFQENGLAKTQVIKNGENLEIWTIRRVFADNSVHITIHSPEGIEITSKRLPFENRQFFYSLYGIEQLQNGDIWLVANGEEFVSDKPYFKEISISNYFHLIRLSSTGELLNQAHVEGLGFVPPEFPGGFPMKFFGLYQGENGLILSGKWFYSFLVQFNSEDSFSPC